MISFKGLVVCGNAVTLIANGLRITLTRPSAVLLLKMLQDEEKAGNLSLDEKDISESLEAEREITG